MAPSCDAIIVDVLRAPVGKGKRGGALSHVHPVNLLADVLTSLVRRNDLDPALVEDVIGSCAYQGGGAGDQPHPQRCPGCRVPADGARLGSTRSAGRATATQFLVPRTGVTTKNKPWVSRDHRPCRP
jgi:acetyl-CoA acetyltransferase